MLSDMMGFFIVILFTFSFFIFESLAGCILVKYNPTHTLRTLGTELRASQSLFTARIYLCTVP